MAWFIKDHKCPSCDHEWTDAWECLCDDECPECGTDTPPHTWEDWEDDEDAVCENCGDTLNDGSDICSLCGGRFV